MIRIYLSILIFLVIIQACGVTERVEKKTPLTTTPAKMELAVNTQTDPYLIPIDYSLNIPAGYLPPCAQLIYSPRLVTPENEYALTPVVISGKKYDRLDQRLQFFQYKGANHPEAIHYLSDGDSLRIPIKSEVPFQLWMPQAKLIATVTLEACNDQTVLYTQTIAGGILYIPVAPGPALVKYVQKEITKKEEGFARFFYPVNGYKVDPALQNNRVQLEDMTELIHKIISDTLHHLNKIVVTGICSPEGPYVYNENLARKRAEFISQYLSEHDNIAQDKIETQYIAEDWPGLRKLVLESSEPGMNDVLNILDGPYDEAQREALLRKSPLYNYIKLNLFPQLRKVTYEVFYTTRELVEEVVPE